MAFDDKFQEFLDKVGEDPVLSPVLTSTSAASVFRNFGAIFAQISQDFDDSFDAKVENAANTIQNLRAWSVASYKRKAFAFQYGDQLTVPSKANDYQQYYEVIDETKQIIKFFALEESIGQVILKLGKKVDGLPVKLDGDELNSVIDYFNEITEVPNFLKTPTDVSNIISIDGDIATFSFKCFLDPKKYIVNSSDPLKNGTNILTGVKDVEVAFNDFVVKEKVNDFGGYLRIAEIEAQIFNIVGVSNFVITAAEGKKFDNTGVVNILTNINKEYKPASGYFQSVVFGTLEYLKG